MNGSIGSADGCSILQRYPSSSGSTSPARPLIASRLPALGTLALLAGCTAPLVNDSGPAPEGTAVALGQPVRVGQVIATPKAVIEDSRCPKDVRCVWAGRLIVSTRIDGTTWHQTVPLTLGKTHSVRDVAITLAASAPERRAGSETPPAAYRFTFEGGR
jgi:hypothetical protein